MRPNQPRLRSLIFAVGIAAFLMGGLRWLITRRAGFLSKAAFHDSLIMGRLPGSFKFMPSGQSYFRAWGGEPDGLSTSQRAARDRWHGELRNKYLRASTRPWFPAAPDPPEPEWARRMRPAPVELQPARFADPYDPDGTEQTISPGPREANSLSRVE
jgi:hypothetical protein